MVRRFPGDPNVAPYAGSEEQRQAERARAERTERIRFGPADPGPCPMCGARRELRNPGYVAGTIIRPLDWACTSGDPLASRHDTNNSHYRESLEPAVWDSEAAHYAYWMAADLLRLAAETGEETELPVGAVYEALDGSGQRWVYAEAGWQPAAPREDG